MSDLIARLAELLRKVGIKKRRKAGAVRYGLHRPSDVRVANASEVTEVPVEVLDRGVKEANGGSTELPG